MENYNAMRLKDLFWHANLGRGNFLQTMNECVKNGENKVKATSTLYKDMLKNQSRDAIVSLGTLASAMGILGTIATPTLSGFVASALLLNIFVNVGSTRTVERAEKLVDKYYSKHAPNLL